MPFTCTLLALALWAGTGGPFDQQAKGPGRYRLLDGKAAPVRIPFRMLRGKPVMDLEISGQKATLMIDNGRLWDQVWLFGTRLVDRLGLKPAGKVVILGIGKDKPTEAYAPRHAPRGTAPARGRAPSRSC